MRLVLAVDILPYAHYAWKRCTSHDMTAEQEQDLVHMCSHRKSGLFASRGYGKTLMDVIIESFLASRGWKMCHLFLTTNQATQWYEWFRKLGWRVSQWHATYGSYVCYLRIYAQGRGPRMDGLINDEIGTVITDIERAQFSACQEMLSGSQLGFAKYTGTRDPNSLQSKYEQCLVIRPYDPITMPWSVMQYEDAKLHNSPAYMDCEYHMKATPAGGLILIHMHIIPEIVRRVTHRFGIDSNPIHGFYVVGQHTENMSIYLTEAYCFDTLEELSDFILSRPECEFELEMNGVGGVVALFLRSKGCHFKEFWTDDNNKVDRCVYAAVREIYIPEEYEHDVYPVLNKQIWDGKKVMKFNDAHYFDAFWLSVGTPTTGYIPAAPKSGMNLGILEREAMRR